MNINTMTIINQITLHSVHTVYHEIYATKYFCEFCKFCSVAKLKLQKIPQFHCHVVQFAAIRKNLFCEILELQDSQNFLSHKFHGIR